MRRSIIAAVFCLGATAAAEAGTLWVWPWQPTYPVSAANPLPGPPRRYLTSFVASYPFGRLREDYTPLGAPGVSRRAYYGSPAPTATLHVAQRRHVRIVRRAVVTAAY